MSAAVKVRPARYCGGVILDGQYARAVAPWLQLVEGERPDIRIGQPHRPHPGQIDRAGVEASLPFIGRENR